MTSRGARLSRASYPAFRDRILAYETDPEEPEPRSYPGHPTLKLPRAGARWWASLSGSLGRRRSASRLPTALPGPKKIGALLQQAHGITGPHGAGPVPSAGGLQALELYLAPLSTGWLGDGVYHYDRRGHHLSWVAKGQPRAAWAREVPSLERLEGGSLLWLLVGDRARVERKYGERAPRFLLLEAGHLMQNLALVSVSLGLCTVPLGGALEGAIERRLALPRGDELLYVGSCGG
jgi:SagB-type dehydrogenase family enzyme